MEFRDNEWVERIHRVLNEPERHIPLYQPIVDTLRGTIAGFELLSRFALPGGDRPLEWFAAAARLDLVEHLDALVLRRALGKLAELPANTFLTVNLTTRGAASPEVRHVLESAPALRPLVIELTELTETDDPAEVSSFVRAVRARDGMIAVDDIGTGYSSLQRILSIRPEFVKIDRGFVSGLHHDVAKIAAIEMIGGLADRIDGWVIAEGVECLPELDRLVRLRVPLAQGLLFAAPGPETSAELDGRIAFRRNRLIDLAESQLLSLVDEEDAVREDAPSGTVAALFAADPDTRWIVRTDLFDRPTSLAKRGGEAGRIMCVHPGATTAQIARRAMARRQSDRFDPVAMCDGRGRYIGTIRMERLIDHLTGGELAPEISPP